VIISTSPNVDGSADGFNSGHRQLAHRILEARLVEVFACCSSLRTWNVSPKVQVTLPAGPASQPSRVMLGTCTE
jgi:hypothetical protein